MRNYFSPILLLFFPVIVSAQLKNDALLKDILLSEGDSLIQRILDHPDIYRYQVIYTQIDRDKNNKPSFTNYYCNVDADRYFNPASVVKMPLAFLSLEKLTKMKIPGVNKFTPMQYDSSWSGQTKTWKDSTSANGLPSISQFIRKAFLISDNDAYNRMYEFVGQQTINRRLHEMGYPAVRITRRFMRMTPVENRHTNAIRFITKNGALIYRQPPAYNTDSFDFTHTYKMGNAHYNADDSLVNEPIDFTMANNLPLENMHQLLQSVLFPGSVPAKQRFQLTKDDEDFLYRFLSQYPSETSYPKYDTGKYYDSYVKFFFRNDSHVMPPHVRVFNKVGWAYGCLTDVSYVADFKNKIEFMLAVTLYVNSDGVMNDDKYDYETIGWPFLYKTGQTIYRYEAGRKRKYSPDLSRFTMEYQKRKEDQRPAVKDADN